MPRKHGWQPEKDPVQRQLNRIRELNSYTSFTPEFIDWLRRDVINGLCLCKVKPVQVLKAHNLWWGDEMAKKKEETAVIAVNSMDGDAPALVISPGKAPAITGNFETLRSYLEGVRERYADVDIEKAGIDTVQKIKKQMQTLRITATKLEKQVVTDYFDSPKKIIKGEFAAMYPIISEIEDKCDAAIEKEDQKRIDGINQAIDDYIETFQKKYSLNPESLGRIERRKAYYNKGQDEKDTKFDLEEQFSELSKAQKAAQGSIKLVQKACEKDKRLSSALFLDMLKRGDDVASVLERIDEELERLDEVDAEEKDAAEEYIEDEEDTEAEAEEVKAAPVKSMADEVQRIDFSSDLPQRTKLALAKIEYPVECSDAMTELFSLLRKRGIKTTILAAGDAVPRIIKRIGE